MAMTRNKAALRRLVARHPGLNQDPAVVPLLLKADLKDEDILSVSQVLLLRPDLTVATAGCFRHLLLPMARDLVDVMRQRHSMRMLLDNDEEVDEEASLAGLWNLYVHEYVSMALSRILELAPYLLSTVLLYFSFAPPPFQRLSQRGFPEAQKGKSVPHLLDVVRASYRFIQLEPTSFEGLWDWTPFLDLLLWVDTDLEGNTMSQNTADIRWCAIQILSLVTRMTDESTRVFSLRISYLTEEVAFACLLRWEDFCQEIAIEKAGWLVEPHLVDHDITEIEAPSSNLKLPHTMEDHQQVTWKCRMSKQISHVEICGVELPVRKDMMTTVSLTPSFGKSLVFTSSLINSLKALVLALSQSEPVLLEGPVGSGKTSLIQELGQLTGNSDAIFIHLDDQMDSKTLLGTYVCTEIPGEFRWQPGALTQAVLKGLWVVFEDIDKVPFGILSALVPLLEDRKLYIPGRGETVLAAEGFQLLATVTKTNVGSASHSPGWEILNNHWRKVLIEAPNDDELAAIIQAVFPSLTPIVPKLIGTFKLVNGITLQLHLNTSSGGGIFFGRQFSIRELLKLCRRIMNLKEIGVSVSSTSVCEAIYTEAVDCFAGYIGCKEDRCKVMEAIARLWGVTDEQVCFLETLKKPLLQILPNGVQVGRVCLPCRSPKEMKNSGRLFADTGHAMRNLERIAVCVQQQEPILLVGETGTGKTTLIQHLAEELSMPLTIMNLSQQSDSADFLGGFKPVEALGICMCLLQRFIDLFCRTFPSQQNAEFLVRLHQFAEKKKLKQLLRAFGKAVAKVGSLIRPLKFGNATEENLLNEFSKPEPKPGTKKMRHLSKELVDEWNCFSLELCKCECQVEAAESTFAFCYVEGAFVKAFRHGYWILLDELNLAPVETLQRLAGVLDGEKGSLSLTERGDIENIPRHPDFRLFACMNPATDVGKHDLPISLKNRFTEFYVDELTNTEDLHSFVYHYLVGSMPCPPVADIVDFYKQAQQEADTRLFDGANQKPRYSLRSLARALEYTRAAMPLYGFLRALYDGICMTFLTLLDCQSSTIMENLISSWLLRKSGLVSKANSLSGKVPRQPSSNHVLFEQFWIERGNFKASKSSLESSQMYVLTKSVREHLKNLAKAVFIRRYPVLLQGPTSSGKTSLIEYLATITDHRFVRINNHEHTDIQEYLGTYVTDTSGKLVFQEGILVEAIRNGYWIVLDELNLAPSEVLEALNRLLDDNRELFVPELQIMVKPHPHFMLFATQNPPGVYGGRKVLSRAFRNRFLELHVDDIPEDELCTILEKRCGIPGSYAQKMVAVMKDLQRNRQSSQAFAGKHGFITPRDLFRWADRHRKVGISYEDLAKIGYILLAERLRELHERLVVLEALEKNLRVKINLDTLYDELSTTSQMQKIKIHLESPLAVAAFGKIVWTKSMKRLFSLVAHCYEHKEPMLLVGETGCGKTTVCQLLAMVYEQSLHILNCHQHTETADFLGGFRPVRERESIASRFELAVNEINSSKLFCQYHTMKLLPGIENSERTISAIGKVLAIAKDDILCTVSGVGEIDHEVQHEIQCLESIQKRLLSLQKDWQSLFLWHNGPLVEAMRKGDLFLVDEISLADDSVLERLNSVLEPRRLLVLAEKGGSNVEEIVAHPKFLLMATMNPGGDFGKKELSPALRNRFTEIWVPPITDEDDLRSIIVLRLSGPYLAPLVDPLLNFWKWFQQQNVGMGLTVRDLLSWICFVNKVEESIGMYRALIHGAYLVLLDGISLGTGLSIASARVFKNSCLEFLLQQIPRGEKIELTDFEESTKPSTKLLNFSDSMVGIDPFSIPKGYCEPGKLAYELMAPTTSVNAFRILRAMQLQKPVLIEGSPGVGKTSLITAIANISGHSLIRINLSEQTDMMDLLGSDLPVEGLQGAEFRWSDGIFLQALKAGSWVVLDELNLASQSVLEGLNACLDHRSEVFLPELGCSFKCPATFRIFACQNPSYQGGGRKGLPKSFLNRFTKVFVDTLSEDDLLFISSSLHPSIPKDHLQRLIQFNSRMYEHTMVTHNYGHSGAQWEFNIRDILRSCILIEGSKDEHGKNYCNAISFLEVVYLQRMRTVEDRCRVMNLYQEVFGSRAEIEGFPRISIDPNCLEVGNVCLKRANGLQCWGFKDDLMFVPGQIKCLESIMHCVQHGWMSILVGPHACGKTSLVRLLAKLTGNSLQEFTLSNGTDTTELLGCFEQYDLLRSLQDVLRKAHSLMQMTCNFCLTISSEKFPAEIILSSVKALLEGWFTFQKILSLRQKGSFWSSLCLHQFPESNIFDPLTMDSLSKFLDKLEDTAGHFGTATSKLSSDIKFLGSKLAVLKEKMSKKEKSGQFEWVDGGLLKAVEHGEWVLLENANLCNPTVLDRLNPLLEPSGMLLINERGLVNGDSMVVHAHPNFRLFLTVDPSQGEVSRAMRNRGVELYVLQPNWSSTESNADVASYTKLDGFRKGDQDVKRYLLSAGLPSGFLVNAMCKAHTEMKTLLDASLMNNCITLRELSHWVHLFRQLFDRGSGLLWSLHCSWEQIYVQSLDNVEARVASVNIFNAHFSELNIVSSCSSKATLQVPVGWPRPLNVNRFCRMSIETVVMRDCMYLELLIGEQVSCQILSGWCQLAKTTCEQESLYLWILKRKDVATMFPVNLFQFFLHPLSTVEIEAGKPIQDMKNFDSMVLYAGLWMMEQDPCTSARNIRLMWLKNLSGNVGFYCHSLKLLCKVIDIELQHTASKQIVSQLDDFNLSKVEPVCAGKKVQHLYESDAMNATAVSQIRVFLGKKLCAVRCTLLQWEIEDEIFVHVENMGFSKAEPSVVLSFRYHGGQSHRKMNLMEMNGLVEWFYPLLQYLRNFEEEVLACNHSGWNGEDDEQYFRILECHKVFWKVVYKADIETQVLYNSWKRLKYNAMSFIPSLLKSNRKIKKVVDQFLQVCQRFDAALTVEVGSLKCYLWKYGGHPRAPSSKGLYEQLHSIWKFSRMLWPGPLYGGGKSSQIITSQKFRCLVLEGLSMAFLVIHGLWEDKQVTSILKDVGSERHLETTDILKMLTERLDAEKEFVMSMQRNEWFSTYNLLRFSTASSTTRTCKCSPPHCLEDIFPPEMVLLTTSSSSLMMVLPWLDSLSLRQDATILTHVSYIFSGLRSDDASYDISTQEMVETSMKLLEVIKFSLKFSTRSPLDFVPHQQLLWMMNANVDGEDNKLAFTTEIQNFTHQSWFNWHSATWKKPPECDMDWFSHLWSAKAGPARLFQASESIALSNFIIKPVPVRDYYAKIVQLRLVAKVLWSCSRSYQDNIVSDFERAYAVFYQIILSFAKSFKESELAEVKSLLLKLHGRGVQADRKDRRETLWRLRLLLENSEHPQFVGLIDDYIFPCMKLMFLDWCRTLQSADLISLHGNIWLLLGSIRLRLLLPSRPHDPAAKYSYKHASLCEQIAELRLELQVRQESDLVLRGGIHMAECSQLHSWIKELEEDARNAASKIVYRPQPSRFPSLYKEINDFILSLETSNSVRGWIGGLRSTEGKENIDRTSQEVQQWQEVAMQFMYRLSTEYPEYQDIVQPVQLSVFELKLGLSLIFSAWLQKSFLMQEGFQDVGLSLSEILCELMEFPSAAKIKFLRSNETVQNNCILSALPARQLFEKEFIYSLMGMPEPCVGKSKEGAIIGLRMKIFQSAMAHMKMEIMHAGLLHETSFKVAIQLLYLASAFWVEIRDHLDDNKEKETDMIQLKYCRNTVETEFDQDETSFRNMFPEYLRGSEDNAAEDSAKLEVSNRDWTAIEDMLSREITHFQSEIFGRFGTFQWSEGMLISELERLDAFSLAYDAGKLILEAAGHMMLAHVNERLFPAHYLRLCLEHERMVLPFCGKMENVHFNIYEDPNAPEIAAMLEPLARVQERVSGLLNEWPEQPVLLQLAHSIQSLLIMSLDSPVMKALLGIEHLLEKAQLWEENAPKHLSIAGDLERLSHLVSRWRKIELEYWLVLFEREERQSEVDAEKLWLPLNEVLHMGAGMNSEPEWKNTIASLEEFMQSATLGEYRRRLDIIFGFYGQFFIQKSYEIPPCGLSSSMVKRLARILYNIFKYYSQFLPLVEESITSGKTSFKTELEDFTRLWKWDNHSYYSVVSSAEKTHRKVHKLVIKYKDLLRTPVLKVLNEKLQLFSSTSLASNEQDGGDENEKHSKMGILECWLPCMEQKVQRLFDDGSQNLGLYGTCHGKLLSLLRQLSSLLRRNVFSEAACKARQRGAVELEDLGSTIIVRASELREGEKKRMTKKKAFVDLLKALRHIGLSHHRSVIPKNERNASSWYQQAPSEVDSLFKFWIQVRTDEDFTTFVKAQLLHSSSVWRRGSTYYFRNMAMLQQLRQSSLSFNKDLTLQEVSASTAYTEHLLYAQRRQRYIAHEFALKLVSLQSIMGHIDSFGNFGGVTKLGQQSELRKWMWRQKDLLDSLCNICSEASLFYKMVKMYHNCPFESSPSKISIIKDVLENVAVMLSCCKGKLDQHLVPGVQLLCSNDVESTWPILITPEMKKTLIDNFEDVIAAKTTLDRACLQVDIETTESGPALRALCAILYRGVEMFKNFKSLGSGTVNNEGQHDTTKKELEGHYDILLSEVMLSVQALRRLKVDFCLGTLPNENDDYTTLESSTARVETIQSWASFIEDQMSALRLERIYCSALAAIVIGVKHFDIESEEDTVKFSSKMGCISELVKFILAAGLLMLCDYVSLYKSLAKLGYIVASIFGSLFCEGYCVKKEEPEDIASDVKDAFGTGMGEGEGKTDVSQEIEDEDQLMGSSIKGNKDDHLSKEKTESTEGGIEMEQDFEGEMFDLSESESDETGEENDQEQQLESKMGVNGVDEDIVDEKLWNKEDDGSVGQSQKEKYETGPPVQNPGVDLEFRAIEDSIELTSNQEYEEQVRQNQELISPEASMSVGEDFQEDLENLSLDHSDAYEDQSGVDPVKEDVDLPETLNLDAQDEQKTLPDESNESIEDKSHEDDMLSSPGVSNHEMESLETRMSEMDNDTVEQLDESDNTEKQTECSNYNQGIEPHPHLHYSLEDQEVHELQEIKETSCANLKFDSNMDGIESASVIPTVASSYLTEQVQGQESCESQMMPGGQEQRSSTSKYQQSSGSDLENRNRDLQSFERFHANPYRSLGDALKAWKERVLVKDEPVSDARELEGLTEELPNEGDEYEFVTENKSSSAQALGSATADQLEQTKERESFLDKKDFPVCQENTMMRNPEVQKEGTVNHKLIDEKPLQTTIRNKPMEKTKGNFSDGIVEEEASVDAEMIDRLPEGQGRAQNLESYISTRSNHAITSKLSFGGQTSSVEEMQMIRKELEINLNEGPQSFEKARIMWTRYEQLTTRLSQELSEQLRLIMEPTLATRLEGDYRTGKRINMKKVIPYIASQFRKDKIWLRRTKPSKRQYQVVLAIDDSKSMSESHCGHMALEALITISRAMSTLEVGQMAVASFGEKGNVKLLHDFDSPFSAEAGIQMISQFSFKQDNTIADEPMVDLLHYLTRLLDFVAKSASVSSGRNSLQQLSLIIADGRFHEKETLRQCIREAVSRRQMLAFIILDNLRESILDVQSVSFTGGAPTFTKYIDSFPFPYYILLKDITALPRTLVDLLRQWFELTQRTSH